MKSSSWSSLIPALPAIFAAAAFAQEERPERPDSIGSLDELASTVAAMRVKDVAWRKIAWRTCLLKALAESRAQEKPLILWVFIDRPVDDKRC